MKMRQAAEEFLQVRRIAVTGVSRSPQQHGANVVYKRLRECGYDVFAINPSTTSVEGDSAYPSLAALPHGVDAVVIGTRPEHAEATVRECIALGIDKVWMHRSMGGGSVSESAAALAREHGITVIAGGCPLMYEPVSDAGHKAMRTVLAVTHRIPARV